MTQTANPVLRYLHHKRWRWVSNTDLIRATGCGQEYIDETLERTARMKIIEVNDTGSGREYRYIGNTREPKRIAVEYLRRVYPNAATVHRISSESKREIPNTLHRFTDLLPIERVHDGYPAARYRYVPNDRRSLMDPVQGPVQKIRPAEPANRTDCRNAPRPRRPCVRDREQLKADIMTHLITTRAWFTTSALVQSMGVSNVRQVSGLLRDMVRNNYPIETHSIQENYTMRTIYHYTGAAA